jgi:hypothetical protein
MANEIKKTLKKKFSKIILTAAAINLAVFAIIFKTFPIDTALIYMSVNVLSLFIIKIKKPTALNAALVGAIVVSAYNVLGSLLGLFSIVPMVLVTGAIQQGIITYVVARFGGLK